MEAPSPLTFKPELEEEIKDIKEYNLDSNSKSFSVKIGKLNNSQKIVFMIQEINSLQNYNYRSDFSLENLKNLSKLFRIFDSIEEAFNEINNIINNKKIIIKEESNEINLFLTLSNLSSKTETICIKIKKKNLSNDKINEVIFKELKEIKNSLKEEKIKNENLKRTVDELIKENNQLKEKVKQLFDWKETQQRKNINNNDTINNNNKYNIDSKIINKTEEIELLANRLTSKGFLKNKKVIFNLLYRASRDGDSPNNYHKKCDNKINTLCIIQTIKGCKFGGYTEAMIKSNNSADDKDPNAFVFSLNKMKIYENMKKENNAVCHSPGWGPIFRADAFAVYNKDFFSYNYHVVGNKSQSNFGVMNEDYEINNGDHYFSIRELEVFQIIIE